MSNRDPYSDSTDALILERSLLVCRIPLSCSGRLLCFYLEKRKTKGKRVTGQGICSMGASAGGMLDPGGEGLPGVGCPTGPRMWWRRRNQRLPQNVARWILRMEKRS